MAGGPCWTTTPWRRSAGGRVPRRGPRGTLLTPTSRGFMRSKVSTSPDLFLCSIYTFDIVIFSVECQSKCSLKFLTMGKNVTYFSLGYCPEKKKRDAPSSMTLLILVIHCTFFVDIFASSLLLFSYFLHFLYRLFSNLLCVCFLYMLVLYLWCFLSSLLLTCITFLLLFDLIYLPNRHFDHMAFNLYSALTIFC